MKAIPKYDFHKTKYGNELLIDVVELKDIKKYIQDNPLHTLTYYDVTIISEGEGFFDIENTQGQVKESDILFTLPNQLRKWDTQNIINGYALIFEEEFLLSFFNDADFLNNISYLNRATQKTNRLSLSHEELRHTERLILEIKSEIKRSNVNKHILRALLYQILIQLDRIFIEQNSMSPNLRRNRYVDSFYNLVHAHYRKSHTIQHYANELCLTPNYLNELVKREMRISAKQVIQNKLMAESKKLLTYSDLSITEISESLSFETASYFIRFFRKRSGFTPLQYRKHTQP